MTAKKYNPETRNYTIVKIPEKSCVNCEDINQIVQCAECGKEILYIDTFASSNIRSFGGFGYAICKQCAEKEKELAKEFTIHIHKEI